MQKRALILSLLALVFACAAGFIVYNLPPVHERLAWRVAGVRTRIYHAINPPEEVVFVPEGGIDLELVESLVEATMSALASTQAAAPSETPIPSATLPGPTPTPQPSPTPTFTPTPIPDEALLSGLVHEYQMMNNCGPATLAMLLSYWGWQGDQRDTRAYLRPNHATVDDKNVMPSELAAFIETQTGLRALVRVGGDLPTLKRLIAAGFPVIIEKGFQPPKEAWMGHYEVLNGYSDERSRFITQDSYIMPDFPLPYSDLGERWWRDFNYVYLVAYPPESESQVMTILAADADPRENYRRAAQKALEEVESLSGRDLFFAWFNRGTNLEALGEHEAAAAAYDQAFAVYAALPESERPWRTLWYQTGPYQAYYNAGRYQDVINLANTTLSFLSAPILEETLYWRGMAKEASGNLDGAVSDYNKALAINPTSTGAAQALERLGVAAP